MNENKITWGDLHLVWVSDFYDMPLKGICRHNGRLHEFHGDYETGTYQLEPLTVRRRARWLATKWWFETCVGRHWSYDGDGRQREIGYVVRSPKWLYRRLFKLYYWMRRLG